MTVGAGVEYQLKRKNEGAQKGFNHIPLYGLGRYQVNPFFYLTGKVGYNISQVEDSSEVIKVEGGLFYGFGGGMVLSDMWELEILYSTHNGKFEPKENPGFSYYFDWKYSKIGLSLGLKC